jgi:hypothetical protein
MTDTPHPGLLVFFVLLWVHGFIIGVNHANKSILKWETREETLNRIRRKMTHQWNDKKKRFDESTELGKYEEGQ